MPTVLLIDHHAPSVKLARLLLEETGCSVAAVLTFAAAHEFLAHTNTHLIAMELSIPNAFDQITSLRLAALDTPIVAVTSMSGFGAELRARTAGCIAFIRKPIDVTTFATQLLTFTGDLR